VSGRVLAPWRNGLEEPALDGRFARWEADPEATVVLAACGVPPEPDEKVLVVAGTDVSGTLHLGHLYNLLCASAVAGRYEADLVVTVNEPESMLCRSATVDDALANRAAILATLDRHALATHRRLDDPLLMLLAFALFAELSRPERAALLAGHYGEPIEAADLLGVCVMVAVPAALGQATGAQRIVAVYGHDELAHLTLIEDLYRAGWFAELLRRLGVACPRFGFVATRLVPCGLAGSKMSKSIPIHAVAIDAAAPAAHCPAAAAQALEAAAELAASQPLEPAGERLVATARRVIGAQAVAGR
jgi:hypothetical protein